MEEGAHGVRGGEVGGCWSVGGVKREEDGRE